jgi:hypothetical protein
MNSVKIVLLSTLIIVTIVGATIYGYNNYFGPKIAIQTNKDVVNCRQGNVLNGVDRQARFTVLSTCEKVVGLVHDMKNTTEEDGDFQFNLAVSKPYEKLLNQENKKQVNNMLVMEIISSDQNSSKVQIPKNGQQIEAIGAWVTDNPHGWNELHPVWSLKIL